jgi:hypothetical protein
MAGNYIQTTSVRIDEENIEFLDSLDRVDKGSLVNMLLKVFRDYTNKSDLNLNQACADLKNTSLKLIKVSNAS